MSHTKKSIFALISRILIGGVFIGTGWLKVSAMTMTIGYFASMGLPAFFAYLVGYVELIGGILVVIGLWECFAEFILGVVMLFAIGYGWAYAPEFNMPVFQAVMPPLAVLGALVSMIALGAGKFAVRGDRKSAPTV